MTELTDDEKRAILQQYLGSFYCYFNDDEEKIFSEKFPTLESCIIQGNYESLKKAVCYLLLREEKRLIYYFLKTNDLLDKMLTDNSDPLNEDFNFHDLEEVPLLIVYQPRLWKRNRIMWETLNYLLVTREAEKRKTLIITDARSLSDEHGSLSWDNWVRLGELPNENSNTSNGTSLYGD